jgi:hypothetical protein
MSGRKLQEKELAHIPLERAQSLVSAAVPLQRGVKRWLDGWAARAMRWAAQSNRTDMAVATSVELAEDVLQFVVGGPVMTICYNFTANVAVAQGPVRLLH